MNKIKRSGPDGAGYLRDYDYERGKELACKRCGKEYYDAQAPVWARKPDGSCDLDRGIAGFAPAHDMCRACAKI